MIPDKIDLEIVTPERLVLAETVDSVILPGSEGYLGVLPSHAPLLTRLNPGQISFHAGGRERFLAVSGGYVEILRDRVCVLAETCEMSDEIDLDRAMKSKDKADGMLADKEISEDRFRRAEVRLKRAMARIRAHELGRG